MAIVRFQADPAKVRTAFRKSKYGWFAIVEPRGAIGIPGEMRFVIESHLAWDAMTEALEKANDAGMPGIDLGCEWAYDHPWKQDPAAPVPVVVGACPGTVSWSEQTEWSVYLTGFLEESRISVIRCVRDITGLSLRDAKDRVLGVLAPGPIAMGISREEAKSIADRLIRAGGMVNVQ